MRSACLVQYRGCTAYRRGKVHQHVARPCGWTPCNASCRAGASKNAQCNIRGIAGRYQQQRAPPTPRKAKKRYSKRGGSARPSLSWRLPLMLERRSRKESGKDGASTWFQVSGPLLEASEAGRRQRDVAPRRPRASTGRAHGANGGAEAGEWGSRDKVQSEVLREAPLVVVEPEAEYALGSWRRQDRFLLPRVHLPVGWAAECRRAPSSRRWKPRAGNYRGITTKSRYFRTMPTWK